MSIRRGKPYRVYFHLHSYDTGAPLGSESLLVDDSVSIDSPYYSNLGEYLVLGHIIRDGFAGATTNDPTFDEDVGLFYVDLTAAETETDSLVVELRHPAAAVASVPLFTNRKDNLEFEVLSASSGGSFVITSTGGGPDPSDQDDFYNGLLCVFTTGNLAPLARAITSSADDGTLTFEGTGRQLDAAFPVAPTAGDRLILIGLAGTE